MNERAWVESTISLISERLRAEDSSLKISCGSRLSYAYEIREYTGDKPALQNTVAYETDVLITEEISENVWKLRVVIEAKLNRNTRDWYRREELIHEQTRNTTK